MKKAGLSAERPGLLVYFAPGKGCARESPHCDWGMADLPDRLLALRHPANVAGTGGEGRTGNWRQIVFLVDGCLKCAIIRSILDYSRGEVYHENRKSSF